MRLYNGDEVIRYCSAIIGSRAAQDTQSRQAQDRMRTELMAGRASLRALPVDKNRDLLDILTQASHDTLTNFDAKSDHQDSDSLEDVPDLDRLLNVSIIDQLEDRYAGNVDKMHSDIRSHMASASCMLKFNNIENSCTNLCH